MISSIGGYESVVGTINEYPATNIKYNTFQDLEITVQIY